jgi:hypothetical protein
VITVSVHSDDISSSNRRRLSGPGLGAFLRIAEQWHLTADNQTQALGISSTDFAEQTDAAMAGCAIELPVDIMIRISAILGIYKALATLFDEQGRLD